MTANGLLQIGLYSTVLLALVKPLGSYMSRVYQGESVLLDRILGPVERFIYRLGGLRQDEETGWKDYAIAFLLFSAVDFSFCYALLRLQQLLPLNPQGFGPMSPHLAFNTAISFVTNTNWQSYSGETTLGYLAQTLGLTVTNFVSAAAGMAVLVAFIRGLSRRTAKTIGNFWVDLTRGTLYILMPLSVIVALILVSQGVVQTMSDYPSVTLVQPTTFDQPKTDARSPVSTNGNPIETAPVPSRRAVGPAASQIAIKQLGTTAAAFQC
jgi:K+-transporting ATPase ATPase A chain